MMPRPGGTTLRPRKAAPHHLMKAKRSRFAAIIEARLRCAASGDARCNGHEAFPEHHVVPKKLAVSLMIQQETRMLHRAEIGERWDPMPPYLPGDPHGSRSVGHLQKPVQSEGIDDSLSRYRRGGG